MNVQQIIDIERNIAVLERRLAPLLEPDMRDALCRTRVWVAEIVHFAVCFDDVDKAQAAGQMDQDRGAQHREEAITRLVQSIRPD